MGSKAVQNIKIYSVTLWLKPLHIMPYKSVLMPCNAPYNALYDITNYCNCSYNTNNTYSAD